jgi:hypothetical protein
LLKATVSFAYFYLKVVISKSSFVIVMEHSFYKKTIGEEWKLSEQDTLHHIYQNIEGNQNRVK